MGTLTRGRVIRAAELADVKPIAETAQPLGPLRRRVIVREELEARGQAEKIIETARREAEHIVGEARIAARETAEIAAKEADAREQAKLAAAWIALRAREERRAEGDLDRAVQLATVLAERLLGAALEVDPSKAALLAQHALSEARGARRATILAHPEDAAAISARLETLGMPDWTVTVLADDAIGRGSVAVQTELGVIDARLRPQLERLAAALREALRSG